MKRAMNGSISEMLSEEVSEETQDLIVGLLKMKMMACVKIFVKVIRSLELKYGPEVTETAKRAVLTHEPRPQSQLGTPENDLHVFCDQLEKGCVGSHRWERVIDEPDRVGYKFHRCLWAEIFNELGAADIGKWLCEGDEPSVRSFNPNLGFSRTKTLMDRQGECDHIFFVRK